MSRPPSDEDETVKNKITKEDEGEKEEEKEDEESEESIEGNEIEEEKVLDQNEDEEEKKLVEEEENIEAEEEAIEEGKKTPVFNTLETEEKEEKSVDKILNGKAIVPSPDTPRSKSCSGSATSQLGSIQRLIISQSSELLEVFSIYENQSKYVIQNMIGDDIFYVKEESSCFGRNILGPYRSFRITISDPSCQEDVIYIERPFRCSCFCFPCCLQTMTVYCPPQYIVGYVRQEWNFAPKFRVEDKEHMIVYRIKGPLCRCVESRFLLLTPDGKEVGTICKRCSGIGREFYIDPNYLMISFPNEVDVDIKALLIGACFLIEFMYFTS